MVLFSRNTKVIIVGGVPYILTAICRHLRLLCLTHPYFFVKDLQHCLIYSGLFISNDMKMCSDVSVYVTVKPCMSSYKHIFGYDEIKTMSYHLRN